jgi:hypothetical protein
MLLKRYDPPGNLQDFAAIPGQLDQWSAAVSGWVDGNIALVAAVLKKGDESQFYNETTLDLPGPPIDQTIGWNALPGTLRNRWGREMALDLAEQMLPLTQRMDGPGSYFVGPLWERHFYRPQDEYCEWHVTRDAQGRITRVTFTSEPPEYWQALHGDTLPDVTNKPAYAFAGDRKLLVELYREFVSPDVQLAELLCQEDFVDYTDPRNPQKVYLKGAYNPYNRWNTTGGIMHLTHPANSLSAEVNLGVEATILREVGGRPVIDPEALICCAAYGGPNRSSDPTIGSTVNELAALGAYVTLRNPVGLAMHHLDLSGFETPTGEPVDASFFAVLRGSQSEGLIERAVFEVPAGEGYTVSDLRIAGVPISRGSQIAEHIVVNIVGRASAVGSFHNTPIACASSCCQNDTQSNWLSYREPHQSCGPIGQAAFQWPPATPAGAPPAGAAALALAAAPPVTAASSKPQIHRRLSRRA